LSYCRDLREIVKKKKRKAARNLSRERFAYKQAKRKKNTNENEEMRKIEPIPTPNLFNEEENLITLSDNSGEEEKKDLFRMDLSKKEAGDQYIEELLQLNTAPTKKCYLRKTVRFADDQETTEERNERRKSSLDPSKPVFIECTRGSSLIKKFQTEENCCTSPESDSSTYSTQRTCFQLPINPAYEPRASRKYSNKNRKSWKKCSLQRTNYSGNNKNFKGKNLNNIRKPILKSSTSKTFNSSQQVPKNHKHFPNKKIIKKQKKFKKWRELEKELDLDKGKFEKKTIRDYGMKEESEDQQMSEPFFSSLTENNLKINLQVDRTTNAPNEMNEHFEQNLSQNDENLNLILSERKTKSEDGEDSEEDENYERKLRKEINDLELADLKGLSNSKKDDTVGPMRKEKDEVKRCLKDELKEEDKRVESRWEISEYRKDWNLPQSKPWSEFDLSELVKPSSSDNHHQHHHNTTSIQSSLLPSLNTKNLPPPKPDPISQKKRSFLMSHQKSLSFINRGLNIANSKINCVLDLDLTLLHSVYLNDSRLINQLMKDQRLHKLQYNQIKKAGHSLVIAVIYYLNIYLFVCPYL
jgi:hypothetical protein